MKEMYNNYEEEEDDWDLPEVGQHQNKEKKSINLVINKSKLSIKPSLLA